MTAWFRHGHGEACVIAMVCCVSPAGAFVCVRRTSVSGLALASSVVVFLAYLQHLAPQYRRQDNALQITNWVTKYHIKLTLRLRQYVPFPQIVHISYLNHQGVPMPTGYLHSPRAACPSGDFPCEAAHLLILAHTRQRLVGALPHVALSTAVAWVSYVLHSFIGVGENSVLVVVSYVQLRISI
ncbi:hypothetical protein OBBRIDRAFT_245516 [Obba rivulosa]|uniref:Uncharacterized protein n=1 Tax=Obba rivulosa TaxID=1052685 RepID=A0A8E2ATA7_9APHY|nr:hypothetical protein OBBRIDRAFT_245516 [Obba rivulosa]